MILYFKSFFFFFQSNAGKSGCWLNLAWKALNWAVTLACMTNLLCCRQHFKICSMQWEPNETWCHRKIYVPSNAIEVMKDLFSLGFWVTALHNLWSPAELTLIRTGCQLTTGSITSINSIKGYQHACVLKNNDGSRFGEKIQAHPAGLHRSDWICPQSKPNHSRSFL